MRSTLRRLLAGARQRFRRRRLHDPAPAARAERAQPTCSDFSAASSSSTTARWASSRMPWTGRSPVRTPGSFISPTSCIHVVNALLVLLIGRALSPRSLAGPLAATAVRPARRRTTKRSSGCRRGSTCWRPCFALAAVCWMVRGWTVAACGCRRCFSSRAPVQGGGGRDADRRCRVEHLSTARDPRSRQSRAWRPGSWYSASTARSVSSLAACPRSAGASRMPKLAAFGLSARGDRAMSDGRWERVRDWLRPRRAQCAVVFVGGRGRRGPRRGGFRRTTRSARPRKTVGRRIRRFLSDLAGAWSWRGRVQRSGNEPGVDGRRGSASCVAAVVVLASGTALVDDSRMWFLAAVVAATLLPISALTEGKRYLYLPSAAVSLIVADPRRQRCPHAWRRAALLNRGGGARPCRWPRLPSRSVTGDGPAR